MRRRRRGCPRQRRAQDLVPLSAVDFDCASKYLTRVVDENGPDVALRTIATLQRDGEIAQQVDDHQLAHAVGRETAKRFGVNGAAFQRCPNIFNYGCVHGFFEYALGQTATPRAAAVSICGSGGKRSEVDRFSCYHGVGHGVMMAKAYDLQGALDVCDTFPTAESEHGCWQGVFMENVNAGMAGKARPGVFVRDQPLAPCTNVAAQYRHECYINHAGWIVLVSSFDIARAARVCMGAERLFRSVCAQSLGLMVTNPSWQASLAKPLVGKRSFEEIAWNLCTRFPSRLRKDCVVAAVDNVANFDQLEVDRSDRFCGLVGESLRGACYKQIGLNLRRRTTSSGAAEDRCDDVAQPASTRASRVSTDESPRPPSRGRSRRSRRPRRQRSRASRPSSELSSPWMMEDVPEACHDQERSGGQLREPEPERLVAAPRTHIRSTRTTKASTRAESSGRGTRGHFASTGRGPGRTTTTSRRR